MIGPLARLTPEARGMAGMIAATLCFAAMDGTVKALSGRIPSLEIVWARYTVHTVLVLLIFLPRLGNLLRTRNPGLQVARSAFLFGMTLCYFFTIRFLPLAEATALIQAGPLLITMLAAPVLRERVGPRRWAGVAVGMAGALVLAHPGVGVFDPAALLGLGAALFLACYQVATRMLGSGDSIWTTLIWSTGLGAIAASAMMPFQWVWPDAGTAGLMLLSGVFGFAAQLCLVWAYTQAEASLLAPFNYFAAVWAVLVGLFAFGETPEATTLAGAAIIIGAGTYVWHRERQARLGAAAAGG